MIRQLFAAFAACAVLAAMPAVPAFAADAGAAPETSFILAKKASDDDDNDKKKVKKSSVVRMNMKTKVYHVKGCEYYEGANTDRMKVAEAKKKGGKPCKKCIK